MKMMNKKIFLFLLINAFIGQLTWADEVFVDSSFQKARREEYHMDSRYRAGEYLIYDCRFKYFACVNKDSFDRCKELRDHDKEINSDTMTCANFGKFDNKESCVLKEYELQDRNILKKFCFRQD